MGHWFGGIVAVAALATTTMAAAQGVGQFPAHRDIGTPKHAGAASYDRASDTYRVAGGGNNMWAARDDFQFAYKQMSGDVAMETQLRFLTPEPAPTARGYIHRKGGLIIRQDLDPDSAYVDALRMGNKQMSLQYREVKGGPTRLIWINTDRQDAVRLEKIGDYAYLSVVGSDGKLRRAGGSFKLKMTAPFYVGLAVCAHDDDAREEMAFSKLRITPIAPGTAHPAGRTLQTILVNTSAEQTALHRLDRGDFSDLAWSEDSKALSYGAAGAWYRTVAWDSDRVEPVQGGATAAASTVRPSTSYRLPADAASEPRPSPDGKWLAWLSGDRAAADMALQVAPIVDGQPQLDKARVLNRFVGGADSLSSAAWSPDGTMIAFVSHD